MADSGAQRDGGRTRRQTPGAGRFQEMLGRRATMEAPRVFGVYVVAPGEGEVRVLGWGMAFADRALFVAGSAERTTYMALSSPGRVLRLLRHVGDVRLVWPEPGARQAGRRVGWRKISDWVSGRGRETRG